MRIVVAEDQKDEANRLARLLTSLGHEVIVAVNGVAAAAACLADAPQAAFLDLLLPGLDGFEVARRLRSANRARSGLGGAGQRSGLWLVAITSLRSSAAEEVARSVGFDAFLHKPYALEDVQAALDPVAAGPTTPQPGGQKTDG